MPEQYLQIGEDKMEKTIEALKKDLQSIKTGRANPALLNHVQVMYYGAMMPINQIAGISVPEPQLLIIRPYDRSSLKDIEKAIQLADLNLNPLNDGTVLRLIFPPLTEETRRKLVKQIKGNAESSKVAIRNIRREANEKIIKMEKEGLISEDELYRKQEDMQKLTDKYIDKVDDVIKEKEKQIMEF